MNQLLGDMHRSRQQRKKLTESVFAVPMVAGSAPVRVMLREKHGECLGASLWASSEVLTEYLGATYLPALGKRVEGMRVLELGCGVGLPGIFCALQGCSVTLTDQEEVLGITRENVSANGVADKAQVAELLWGSLPLCSLESYDLVIGADVLYRQEHLDALLHTLLQVTQPHTEVLIAYKRRVNCDQAFFEAASRDFEISTVWSQSDCHSLQEQGSSGLASSIAVGWGHNGFVGHAKGFGGGISTGDWVSGARCFVLRFCRRPVRVGTEGPVPE